MTRAAPLSAPETMRGAMHAPYRWQMLERATRHRLGRQDLVDTGLVLLMGFVATLEIASGDYDDGSLGQALTWGWLVILPLAVRRRFPVAVWLTVLALTTLEATIYGSNQSVGLFFGLLVGCYTVAAYRPRRTAVLCFLLMVPVVAFSNWRSTGNPLDDLTFIVVLISGFWVAGRVVWSREELIRRLAEQAEQLQRGREAEARALVAEKRARIARDVHDVVAHSVSIMVVQAEAGEAQLSEDSPSAECLRAIQRVGRSTLTELRGVLNALADDAGPEGTDPALAPTPRLADAGILVAELRDAGLDVDFRQEGDLDCLPTGVDLAAYRILQEALTNALRHASGAHVTARVDATGDHVVVEVRDSGAGAASSVNGTGRGLLGMRERVRLYGGEVESGPDGAGFRVRARIPVSAGAAAPP
jgi:signal transduction histidine kinase